MELSGTSASHVSDASAGLRSAKLAKSHQEEQGEQTLQLLNSAADVPKTSSANPALGSNVNTFA